MKFSGVATMTLDKAIERAKRVDEILTKAKSENRDLTESELYKISSLEMQIFNELLKETEMIYGVNIVKKNVPM